MFHSSDNAVQHYSSALYVKHASDFEILLNIDQARKSLPVLSNVEIL